MASKKLRTAKAVQSTIATVKFGKSRKPKTISAVLTANWNIAKPAIAKANSKAITSAKMANGESMAWATKSAYMSANSNANWERSAVAPAILFMKVQLLKTARLDFRINAITDSGLKFPYFPDVMPCLQNVAIANTNFAASMASIDTATING